jgi:16S rRNA (guanine966-N2)-methyltransferase
MVRITAGQFKGVPLITPPRIRITSAKVRQALFNILGPLIEGARVLDGFAGSGALGFEALSRGAAFVTWVDSAADAILCIRDNVARLARDVPPRSWRVVHLEMEQGLRALAGAEPPFDVILLDPPYGSPAGKKVLNTVVECAILARGGMVVVEHDRRTAWPSPVGGLTQRQRHRYGETVLSLYQATSG